MNDRVSLSIVDNIAEVTLNRPEKRNALDLAMFEALAAVGETLRHNRDIRAVVLAGAGNIFCAGIDLQSLSGNNGEHLADLKHRSHGMANLFQNAAWQWRDLPMPVIAAVQGCAYGGGFQIALGADIRIMAADVSLSVMEINWGLVPDMAGIALMRGLARDDIIRELTFTGRTFDGAQAQDYGFATRLATDPLSEARSLAQDISRASPQATRAAKRLLNRSWDADLGTILMAESEEQQALLGSPDQQEAVAARLAKRPPHYRG